jgi:hypothetical protein
MDVGETGKRSAQWMYLAQGWVEEELLNMAMGLRVPKKDGYFVSRSGTASNSSQTSVICEGA